MNIMTGARDAPATIVAAPIAVRRYMKNASSGAVAHG